MTATPAQAVSIVIPSYRRPEDLRRCLAGLAQQSLQPVQTIVVRRADDQATEAVVAEFRNQGIAEARVTEPGVLAAMTAGVSAAHSDIVGFIDDDAVPHPDWLRRLVRHFDDPQVGGVGGRDIIIGTDSSYDLTLDVGRITWWGKVVGNHHLGVGEPRDVLVLKAVGMAFRRSALELPRGLRGAGAQVHFEVGLSLSALRRGWRLIYDPTAVVDHYAAPRFDADQRERPVPSAIRDAAYNLVTCLVVEAPELFWRRAAYGLLVGDRRAPGMLRAAVAVLRNELDVVSAVQPSLSGQLDALRRNHRRRPPARGMN